MGQYLFFLISVLITNSGIDFRLFDSRSSILRPIPDPLFQNRFFLWNWFPILWYRCIGIDFTDWSPIPYPGNRWNRGTQPNTSPNVWPNPEKKQRQTQRKHWSVSFQRMSQFQSLSFILCTMQFKTKYGTKSTFSICILNIYRIYIF